MATRTQSGKKADDAEQDVPITAGTEAEGGPTQDESPRKPSEERPHAFNTAAWVMEGATGLLEEVRHSDLGLSKEFWDHAYTARTETLLAVRTLVDDLIDRCTARTRADAERAQRRQRRGSVNIEF